MKNAIMQMTLYFLNGPILNFFFLVILFYIERKWLLVRNVALKPYYVSERKIFFKEIYRNIQIFAFKLLQECSSWASRNGLVQIFETTQSKFAGKFVKSERFLGVFRVHTIFSVKWVKVRKMSEVFLANVWSFFLASFCWLLDFLLEILKLKKKSMMMSKVLFSKTCPKHYFQKKNFESFIFWSKFRFFGDCFRTF